MLLTMLNSIRYCSLICFAVTPSRRKSRETDRPLRSPFLTRKVESVFNVSFWFLCFCYAFINIVHLLCIDVLLTLTRYHCFGLIIMLLPTLHILEMVSIVDFGICLEQLDL